MCATVNVTGQVADVEFPGREVNSCCEDGEDRVWAGAYMLTEGLRNGGEKYIWQGVHTASLP